MSKGIEAGKRHRIKRNTRESRLFRLKCEALLFEGKAFSKIAKLTGKSYAHTKQICEQIQQEQVNE
jgi:hypothetical protein